MKEIDVNATYPTAEAAAYLECSRKTVLKYANLGRRCGGIDSFVGISGRRRYKGSELKHFKGKYAKKTHILKC